MEIQNGWIYNGEILDKAPIGCAGFIYKISEISTGKFYIGKKAFVHKTKKTLSKRARIALGGRKRIERGTKDSNWLKYWGSCQPLLQYMDELGSKDGFIREVLKICKDKSSLSYYEIKYMIEYKVLFDEQCWNSNVGGKFFKGRIHE